MDTLLLVVVVVVVIFSSIAAAGCRLLVVRLLESLSTGGFVSNQLVGAGWLHEIGRNASSSSTTWPVNIWHCVAAAGYSAGSFPKVLTQPLA